MENDQKIIQEDINQADDNKPGFLDRQKLKSWIPSGLGLLILTIFVAFPIISNKSGLNPASNDSGNLQSGNQGSNLSVVSPIDASGLWQEVLPTSGYTINIEYGDIGPKLIAAGAIDIEKLKQIYAGSNRSLADGELKILTEGSREKIKIDNSSANFLLNFLWAFGLVNQNPILDEGPLMQYGGRDEVGNFASTGGWTIGKKPAIELYSSASIISLTPEQQKILEEVAYNSYRPCCNNSTAFADCNHGMAALALAEIMVSQGASADEIFMALKYFNSFWFPQQYFDLAKYFKAKDGKNWNEVDPRIILGKDYSTASGWSRVHKWLQDNNLIEQAPASGGGCGI